MQDRVRSSANSACIRRKLKEGRGICRSSQFAGESLKSKKEPSARVPELVNVDYLPTVESRLGTAAELVCAGAVGSASHATCVTTCSDS
jgi:hypothetical protein